MDCRARENDFLLELKFEEGCRWSPDVWKPDHLYSPSKQRLKAKRAARG